ncbi:MAG: OmpA family protein [Flavobacteriales bacterium]|nr:OmpA family protein [Flavobacteriales bacterium]
MEIGGHTDNVGSDEANMTLSNNRAASVVEFLVKHGIEASRLSSKGYGETLPVATNDTDEGRAKNRRTEFKIVQ